MILTEIGEIGVHIGDETHTLRPSLYAMTQLGNAREIVSLYAAAMGDAPTLVDCLAVINACADGDVSGAFGAWHGDGDGLTYKPGVAPIEHIVSIARCLLKHGVTGALPDLPRNADRAPEYIEEFDARGLVATAIAHLGMSSAEAWRMTMTELVGALRAKFPPDEKSSPGARAPTLEEHEATMEWFEQVQAARALN